jgi:hypothetical protein
MCSLSSRYLSGLLNCGPSCTNCATGRYSASSSATACDACAIGYFNYLEGQTTCVLCNAGTYTSSAGQSSCTPCPMANICCVLAHHVWLVNQALIWPPRHRRAPIVQLEVILPLLRRLHVTHVLQEPTTTKLVDRHVSCNAGAHSTCVIPMLLWWPLVM